MTSAPDFDQYGYPNGGAKTGPAWRAAWDLLGQLGEATAAELVPTMMVVSGLDRRKSAEELLRRARRSGLLTVTYQKRNDRRTAVYQRAETGE
jgi:uncharacterized pyridoxal phosphate-containing UPF0001 family protein